MSILLKIWAAINALIGILFLVMPTSAIATIEAGIAFLIATVALASVGIIEAVKTTGNNFGITARHSQ